MANKKRSAADGGKQSPGKPKRGPRGQFLPGNTEGPGRPKGSRNKTTLMIEAMLEGQAEQLTQALIRRALRGYSVPLQICFDRLAPPRKDRHIEIKLPPIGTLQDLAVAQGTIIQSAASGDLTPGEAHAMAGLLELRRRTIESIEIEARLAALEARLPKGARP